MEVFCYYIVYGELILNSNPKTCTCPGDVVTYECTVKSDFGGATVFRANPKSLVGCTGQKINHLQNEEVYLPHSQFNQSQDVKRTCNNGTIVGRILSVDDNDRYTSQLNIIVTSELIGDTFECFHDNGTHESEVGKSTINNTGASTFCSILL